MNTQDNPMSASDIHDRYSMAISATTDITDQDAGAVKLALWLAILDATRLPRVVQAAPPETDLKLSRLVEWITIYAPQSLAPGIHVIDAALHALTSGRSQVEELQAKLVALDEEVNKRSLALAQFGVEKSRWQRECDDRVQEA